MASPCFTAAIASDGASVIFTTTDVLAADDNGDSVSAYVHVSGTAPVLVGGDNAQVIAGDVLAVIAGDAGSGAILLVRGVDFGNDLFRWDGTSTTALTA